MQKKLLAAAVLSAFAGAASAQSANVTLYGTLIGSVENAAATGGDSTTPIAGTGNSSVRGAGTVTAATGAIAPAAGPAGQSQRMRMNPAGSNFGIRGTEDLGNGLSAWFQIEIAATLGSPAGATVGPNHGNAPSYRNSAVGLRSNTWGTLALGSWDTPFNVLYGSTNANARTGGPSTSLNANIMGGTSFANGAWSSQNVLAAGCGGGANANQCFNAGSNFDRRQNGLVQWWSPNWSGFELRGSIALPQETAGVTADNRAGGLAAIKYNIWDVSASYTNGPLMVGYAYQRQNDLMAAAAGAFGGLSMGTAGTGGAAVGTSVSGSTGVGHRLGGRYAFALGGGRSIGVGALWESLKWNMSYTTANSTAGFSDLSELKKTGYRLQANFATGSHFFGFEYAKANEMKGSVSNQIGAFGFNGSGTSAKAYILSYNYMMSKRTSVTAYATMVSNDSNAAYSGIVFGGILGGPGSDPKYYGVNLRHAF